MEHNSFAVEVDVLLLDGKDTLTVSWFVTTSRHHIDGRFLMFNYKICYR